MQRITIALFILFTSFSIMGQQNVGVGTASPDPSAILDVSSSDKGMLTPRMATVDRESIVDPAEGLIVFDTSTDTFWYFDGAAWKEIGEQDPSFGGDILEIDSNLLSLIPNPYQISSNFQFGTSSQRILVDGDKFVTNSRLRTYLFQLVNNVWTPIDSLLNSSERLLYYKNDSLITGRTAGTNSIRELNLYTTFNGVISQQLDLLLPEFIRSIFIEGNHCYIGYYDTYNGNDPPQIGAVSIYDMSTMPWTLTQTIDPPTTPYVNDNFGESILLSDDILYIGSSQGGVISGGVTLGSGAVYMYEIVSGNWELMTTIPSPIADVSRRFGYEILTDGENIIIGCNDSGVAENQPIHVYTRVGDSLELQYNIVSPLSGGHFGSEIIIDNEYMVVGNTYPIDDKMTCFLYKKQGTWQLKHRMDIGVSYTGNGTSVKGGIGLNEDFWFYGVSIDSEAGNHGIYYLENQLSTGTSWNDISGIPEGFLDGIDHIDDADSDPSNEFNTSLVRNGNNLELTDGGGTQSLNILEFPNQWTPISNSIYYDSGNVGVGRIPSRPLDVIGTTQITHNSTGTNPHINLVEDGNTNDGARINFAGSPEKDHLWTLYGKTDNTDGDSRFHVYYNSIGNIFTLTGLGKAGIRGTPNTDLHVFHGDNTDEDGMKLQNRNGGNWWRMHSSSSDGFLYLYSTAKGTTSIGHFDDSSGTYTPASDRKLKKSFADLYFDWESFMELQPLTYQFKGKESNRHYIGMVAQDVKKIYPELVSYSEEQDVHHMDYGATGVISIKATQELYKENQALKKELAELYKMLLAQGNRLAQIEAAINSTEESEE